MTNGRPQTDKDTQIAMLHARVAELEAALATAQIDPQFAILTRRGIDQRWHARPAHADTVIFFDIDRVHDHNAQWGYAGTDRRIASVLAQVGKNWVFRWFSGDEFGLLCMGADARGFASRMQELLRDQGMTATFGMAPLVDNDLPASVGQAAALVQAAKAQGRSGTINEPPRVGAPALTDAPDREFGAGSKATEEPGMYEAVVKAGVLDASITRREDAGGHV
jgi:GGDEF domain-containing protein